MNNETIWTVTVQESYGRDVLVVLQTISKVEAARMYDKIDWILRKCENSYLYVDLDLTETTIGKE